MQTNTKQLTTLAMLSALAIISVLLIRFPMFTPFPFPTYDPKDVVIIIGGFLYGPLAAMLIIVVVGLVEMITISETAFWGLLMNIVSSSSFVLPAVLIYRRWRNLPMAIVGLIIGSLVGTGVMLLYNYLIVPLYMPFVTRADVVPMLTSIFLPFNLVKNGLNAAMAVMLYKPISVALTNARLYQPATTGSTRKFNIWVLVASAFVVLTLILIILAERGVF